MKTTKPKPRIRKVVVRVSEYEDGKYIGMTTPITLYETSREEVDLLIRKLVSEQVAQH